MKARARVAIAVSPLIAGAVWSVAHGIFTSGKEGTWQFYSAILMMGVGWLFAFRLQCISARTFWVIAIALRIILLPIEPGADVHRYIWEGRIQTHGFSPYQDAPDAEALIPLRDENWSQVEFKRISAIYPPLAELGFCALASISQSAIFFKLAFTAADLVVCLLLSNRFGFARALLYAWNPLILYSFAGAGHFDSWFILSLVSGWLLWERGALSRATAFFAVATALKWISLPILVWSSWRITRTYGARRMLIAACAGVLPFLVAWLAVTRGHFGAPLLPKEFVLYARSCELMPAIVSWVLQSTYVQNAVYLLPLAAVTLILLRSRSITLFCERWLLALLVLSPMVHAWYFTWLIPFAVATRNAGPIAVSLSAFAYFGISDLPGAPQNGWGLLFLQDGMIWLPLICGFAWSEYQRLRESVRPRALDTSEYRGHLRLSPS